MSADKTQISPVPPVGYGDRFVKFISGITVPREEAEAQAEIAAQEPEMQQLDGYASHRSALSPLRQVIERPERSSSLIARQSSDQVLEHAEQQMRRSGSSDDELPPERHIKPTRSASADRGVERGTSVTLPVVEEVGEGGSTGGRSGNSREREVEPRAETSGYKDANELQRSTTAIVTRQQSNTDSSIRLAQNMLSPPLGGRPPPTPPKDMPNLSTDLPAPTLPMPDLPTSPIRMLPSEQRNSGAFFG